MYDMIYHVLKMVNLNSWTQINSTLQLLEYLLQNIVPDVYFCRSKHENELTWTVKSLSRGGELCHVIIGKNGFEII